MCNLRTGTVLPLNIHNEFMLVKYKDKKTLYTIDLSEVAIRRNRQLFWKVLLNKFNKKICYRFIQPYKSPSIDFRSKPIDWCIYNGMNLWDQGIYKSRSYWSKNQTKLDDILLCIAFSSVTLFIYLFIYLFIFSLSMVDKFYFNLQLD